MNKELKNKKELVDKYFKKLKAMPILDLLLEDVDQTFMYIRLDYFDKSMTYRVSWIDLSAFSSNKAEEWVNSNLIYPKLVENIKKVFAENGTSPDYEETNKSLKNQVIINSYVTGYEYNRKTFTFFRHIPTCWSFLADILVPIFNNMPRVCFSFFQILVESLDQPHLNAPFVCNLDTFDFTSIFNKKAITKAKELKNNLLFIETNVNQTYAIIQDDYNYLTSIYYSPDDEEMVMNCNCHDHDFCSHLYTTLQALQEHQSIKFGKITLKDENKSLLDKIKNFEYFLCPDIDGDDFIVIAHNRLERLPILDEKGAFNWIVIEDNSAKTLIKGLKKYLKSKGIEFDESTNH